MLLTICSFGDCALRVDFFMVVELSQVQVEDVKNPHSGPSTVSTTNPTFNYVRDIAQKGAKGFSSWSQFVAMLFCQLGRAHSLR